MYKLTPIELPLMDGLYVINYEKGDDLHYRTVIDYIYDLYFKPYEKEVLVFNGVTNQYSKELIISNDLFKDAAFICAKCYGKLAETYHSGTVNWTEFEFENMRCWLFKNKMFMVSLYENAKHPEDLVYISTHMMDD